MDLVYLVYIFMSVSVSVSMDVNGEVELTHEVLDHLEAVAESHNFIGRYGPQF